MIFRELNNKLYEIMLPAEISEEEFLEKQKNGTVKFLQVNPEELPKINEDEKRHFSKIFYGLDGENIIIDYERTVEQWLNDKYRDIENYIYSKYPQSKQNSDLSDKIYYENILKSKGIESLENDIITRVKDFFTGKTLEEVIEDISDENKEAYLQLLKVNIRVTWVQMCKDELKKAIDENREPDFPKYPL